FNRVASLANAEFFAFAAADDEWSPRFLEALIAIHERYPDVGLAHSSYDWIDERGDRVRMGKVTWLVSDDSPLRVLLSLGRLKPWAYSFCLQYLWRNPFPFYGLFRRTALAPMLPFADRPSVRHGDNLF